jgi:S-formylglutathione hydrolase
MPGNQYDGGEVAKQLAKNGRAFYNGVMPKSPRAQARALSLKTSRFRSAASRCIVLVFAAILTGTATSVLLAQVSRQAVAMPHGAVERIKIYGTSLQGNLEGDSPDRYVSIYLPPSYKTDVTRRYPVLYFLHGFTDDDAEWYGFKKHWINLPEVIDKALARKEARQMIVVTPDAYTRFAGSMYSDSATTGDWEDYVARDLVSYIDSHYRTIPHSSSRGLAGHSMGGYGALRIAMKHPGIFSSIYLLSPCCLMPSFASRLTPQIVSEMKGVRTDSDFAKAGFFTKAMFASAAAWSPDPQHPPFFLDLPTGDEAERKMVMAKWTANAPLAMIDQYIGTLRRLHAIAFDAGLQDPLSASLKVLDHVLNEYGIKHRFETYQGTHISGIATRIETKALPFFSKNLSFRPAPGGE